MSVSAVRLKTIVICLIMIGAIFVMIPPSASAGGPIEAWLVTEVDDTGNNGHHNSLALDSWGRPHISYYDSTNGRLLYSYYDGTDWHRVNVAPASNRSTSIAIDDEDNVHIAYFYDNNLKYAFFDGVDWDIVSVDVNGHSGCSIAVDSSGKPHIAYYTNSDTYYANWNGTDWVLRLLDGVQGFVTSIAIDDADNVHFSYASNGAGLNYVYWDGISFETQYLGEINTNVYYHSLQTDSLLRPHIAYLNSSGILNYTYKTVASGTDWNKTSISSDKFSHSVSLNIDEGGKAHITSRNQSVGHLQYITNLLIAHGLFRL